MKMILASGGIRTKERLLAWQEAIGSFLPPGSRVLFLPYALADHDRYLRRIAGMLKPNRLKIEGIHRKRNPVAAVRSADHVLVGGGNTFRLLSTLYQKRLLAPIRERIRKGAVYLGVSAGTNVACPTIMTTNDMPIVGPPSLAALGLVPFQINAHYFDGPVKYRLRGRFVPYAGETRDDRIREFHEMNKHVVVALREGAILTIDGRRARLVGPMGGKLLQRGRKPTVLRPGADLSGLLHR